MYRVEMEISCTEMEVPHLAAWISEMLAKDDKAIGGVRVHRFMVEEADA